MRRTFSSVFCVVVLSVRFVFGGEPQLLPEDLFDEEAVQLFDGRTLTGWQVVGDAKWDVVEGAIHTTGDKPGFLMSDAEYGDFELTVEFRAAANTNSGIFFRTTLHPQDPTHDCYELNIAPPDNPFPTGSLVARQKADPASNKFPSHGQWWTIRVRADGGRITVELDGHRVLQYIDPAPVRSGHVGLQANQGEVSFRNLRIVELTKSR